MIYIYNDYAGTHSTAIAAAYHLNKLPTGRQLTKEEILAIDYFNKLTNHDMGRIIFHGVDEDENSVYTLGRKNDKLVVPALKNLGGILQKTSQTDERIVFSNTSPTVPLAMTFGGLFSRRLKIDFIGVPLLVLGAQQCYSDVIQLVEYTKQAGHSAKTGVVILENKSFS